LAKYPIRKNDIGPSEFTLNVPDSGITKRQEIFVEAFLTTKNPQESAEMAGFRREDGPVLLRNKDIKQAIAARLKTAIDELNTYLANDKITPERVLEELSYIAFSDENDFFNEDGSLKMPNEMSKAARSAIAGREVKVYSQGKGKNKTKVEQSKIRVYDKIKALEKLMHFLNMLNTNISIDRKEQITHTIRIEELRANFDNLEKGEAEQLMLLMEKARSGTKLLPIHEEEIIDAEMEEIEGEDDYGE